MWAAKPSWAVGSSMALMYLKAAALLGAFFGTTMPET